MSFVKIYVPMDGTIKEFKIEKNNQINFKFFESSEKMKKIINNADKEGWLSSNIEDIDSLNLPEGLKTILKVSGKVAFFTKK